MCHTIKARDEQSGFVVLDQSDTICVGMKMFLYSPPEGRLRSGVLAKQYEWEEETPLGLLSLESIEDQDLTLDIPCLWQSIDVIRDVTIQCSCPAGYHISPIPKHRKVNSYVTPLPNSGPHLLVTNFIPVLFELSRVTFYDGEDVSVSRFILPNPESMNASIEACLTFGFSFENLSSEYYRLIYENELKRLRKE